MSNTCGDCDCADRSQCVKKGSSYVADFVETDESCFVSTVVAMEVPMASAAENNCKCGPSCPCVNCTCGGGL